jgi:hypothetical protein
MFMYLSIYSTFFHSLHQRIVIILNLPELDEREKGGVYIPKSTGVYLYKSGVHYPPSTPSRRSFPACATNASTISERGIAYINLSAWIHYSGNESVTDKRFVGIVLPEEPLLSRVRHRPKNYR